MVYRKAGRGFNVIPAREPESRGFEPGSLFLVPCSLFLVFEVFLDFRLLTLDHRPSTRFILTFDFRPMFPDYRLVLILPNPPYPYCRNQFETLHNSHDSFDASMVPFSVKDDLNIFRVTLIFLLTGVGGVMYSILGCPKKIRSDV